jgi:hypothetical protein
LCLNSSAARLTQAALKVQHHQGMQAADIIITIIIVPAVSIVISVPTARVSSSAF